MLLETRRPLQESIPRVASHLLDLLDEPGIDLSVAPLRLLPLRCDALDLGLGSEALGQSVFAEIAFLRPEVGRYG